MFRALYGLTSSASRKHTGRGLLKVSNFVADLFEAFAQVRASCPGGGTLGAYGRKPNCPWHPHTFGRHLQGYVMLTRREANHIAASKPAEQAHASQEQHQRLDQHGNDTGGRVLLSVLDPEAHIKVGAHVLTQLGRELVTDIEQALLECVKNAYDADREAPDILDRLSAKRRLETGAFLGFAARAETLP